MFSLYFGAATWLQLRIVMLLAYLYKFPFQMFKLAVDNIIYHLF